MAVVWQSWWLLRELGVGRGKVWRLLAERKLAGCSMIVVCEEGFGQLRRGFAGRWLKSMERGRGVSSQGGGVCVVVVECEAEVGRGSANGGNQADFFNSTIPKDLTEKYL